MQLSEEFDDLTEDYIRSRGWIRADEIIYDYKKAGEGNMNFVVRVQTTKKNFIIKQSRPYVEKYQQIAAPIERIEVEKKYYEYIKENEFLQKYSPEIKDYDPRYYTLVMQDLGYGSDFMGLYSKSDQINKNEIQELVQYLLVLHSLSVTNFPANDKMKALNHEHIFVYPFLEENGFDLNSIQPGLQELALGLKTDKGLKEKIALLGEKYLSTGNTLLHGDFYPGGWLKVDSGLKVIDPEFAFMGDAEFDLGVMLAHLKMAEVDPNLIHFCKDTYLENRKLDEELLNKYTAIEILRRLIGLAQLPLSLSLEVKKDLIDQAVKAF